MPFKFMNLNGIFYWHHPCIRLVSSTWIKWFCSGLIDSVIRRINMVATRQLVISTLLIGVLTACSGMSTKQKNAAVGAGIGGVAGAVLTGGSALGTVGGAAIGGVIGHGVDSATSKKK
jgi:osmotically inducible lipoprotein OsmB